MRPRYVPTLCAVLTGSAYSLSVSNNLDGFPYGILAWISLIPLHVALEGATERQAFFRGWRTGILSFIGSMYWVVIAMHSYGHIPLLISVALMLLLATYLGLYVGLYALIVAHVNRHRPSSILWGAPTLWVSFELLRTYLLSGLPWGLLGYSQFRVLSIIQVADITGVYGISFLVVFINVVLFTMIQWGWNEYRKSKGIPFPWKPLTLATLTLSLVWGYGLWQLDKGAARRHEAPTLRVGLIQANIGQAHKWDTAYRFETMNRYMTLSKQASKETDLIIWPEAATPFLYEQEPSYQSLITALTQETHVPLVLGSPALRRFPDGSPYLLNSAYLLNTNGDITGRYDKQHLVPFGEYIPLRWLLFFLDKLVVGIGDFEPGPGPTLLSLSPQNHEAGPRFGVAICFEVIFPNLVRQLANEGSNFLVTITNDSWFGQTVAPYQHFAMVVFRAVENRMAFARAANTGISGFIASDGRILSKTDIFSEAIVKGEVSLHSPSTFYTRQGDVFAWACVILTGFLILLGRRSLRQNRTNDLKVSPNP